MRAIKIGGELPEDNCSKLVRLGRTEEKGYVPMAAVDITIAKYPPPI